MSSCNVVICEVENAAPPAKKLEPQNYISEQSSLRVVSECLNKKRSRAQVEPILRLKSADSGQCRRGIVIAQEAAHIATR